MPGIFQLCQWEKVSVHLRHILFLSNGAGYHYAPVGASYYGLCIQLRV
jgi:hypothetical protein